jgi:hypothetical protein
MRTLDHQELEDATPIPIPAQGPSARLSCQSFAIRNPSSCAASVSECEDQPCQQRESDRSPRSTTLHHRSTFTVTAVGGLGNMPNSDGVMDDGSAAEVLRSIQQSRRDNLQPQFPSPNGPIYDASETGVLDKDTPSLYVGNLRIDDDVMGDLAVFYN